MENLVGEFPIRHSHQKGFFCTSLMSYDKKCLPNEKVNVINGTILKGDLWTDDGEGEGGP